MDFVRERERVENMCINTRTRSMGELPPRKYASYARTGQHASFSSGAYVGRVTCAILSY